MMMMSSFRAAADLITSKSATNFGFRVEIRQKISSNETKSEKELSSPTSQPNSSGGGERAKGRSSVYTRFDTIGNGKTT